MSVIDTVTRVAPLGVRFFDPVTRRNVVDLVVTARSSAAPARALPLWPNPSGVYVLSGVPGLRDFEFGSGDETFWSSLPPAPAYDILVGDPLGRYLPCRFKADVPTRRLWHWHCGAAPPAGADVRVPLYSAPSRAIPEGMAVARADLHDTRADGPAAWAAVQLRYQGQPLATGIADARGVVAVVLPYPPLVDIVPADPLSTGRALAQQVWPLELRIGYTPAKTAPPDLDLCAALGQLDAPLATAWSDAGLTTPLATVNLSYGTDLILRSSDAGKPLSRLLVTPTVPPP